MCYIGGVLRKLYTRQKVLRSIPTYVLELDSYVLQGLIVLANYFLSVADLLILNWLFRLENRDSWIQT
jgi:hypothetical protein